MDYTRFLAQLGRAVTENPRVPGSSPGGATMKLKVLLLIGYDWGLINELTKF